MRIAQLCPLWEPAPPPAYGGIELVVSLLSEELVRRGHQVTLFAAGNSRTSAELVAPTETSLRSWPEGSLTQFVEWAHVAAVLRRGHDFDIIHNHCGEIAMAFAELCPAPMLTTSHGPLVPDASIVWDRYNGYYNTISKSAKGGLPDRSYVGVVYNGIDVETFPFAEKKEDYLLFLSRISPEKGTHLAIDAAKQLGKKLIIAGKVDRVDRQYFLEQIEPRIDGQQIQFVGEADATQKRHLFVHASCLVHPITWSEPFGLVMVEAMACGTPVVAFRKGAAPELIEHGETGFVVDTLDELVEAIDQIGRISPHRCREHVANRFDVVQMVDGYEQIYQLIAPDATSPSVKQ